MPATRTDSSPGPDDGSTRGNTTSTQQSRAATRNAVVAASGGSRRKKRVTKNKKLGIIDRLIPVGKFMCRMVSFNWNIRCTLDRGIAHLACQSPEGLRDLLWAATDQQKLFDRNWDKLVELAPYVPDLLLSCKDVDTVEMTLDYSKSTSRSEDNSKFKHGVTKWRAWNPALPKGKKGRGLAHPECARMMCPISVNFADPNAREDFVLNKNPPATHHVWPRCSYAGYIGNIKDPKVGFLRSGLMKQGALALMYSPSEAEKEDEAGSGRGTCPGFAATHAITQVSRPFLAYVAVLLRFSLSNEETFCASGSFDYSKYYDDIIEYLEDPSFKETTDELVEWWNEEIFPDEQHARRNPDLSNLSIIAIMRRQLDANTDAATEEESIEEEYQEEPLE